MTRHAQIPARRAADPWYGTAGRIMARALGLALTIALVAIAAAVLVVPRALGGTNLTVLSGSMEPTLSPGDVVVVRGITQDEVCTSVRLGQIVTYLPKPNDPSLITHRVVAKTIGTFADGTSCRLLTQGDANPSADEPVSPVQVRGLFMYGVPKLGWVRQWIGQHQKIVWAGAGVALLGYLIGGSLSSRRSKNVAVKAYLRESETPS